MTSTSATRPTIVLVHGAWADGSSWQRVIPFLMQGNLPVIAVQNPTSSLADDVVATRRVLDRIEGPVVLVGHSWGGTVITEAGTDDKVKALVYVAAFAPRAGQSSMDLIQAHPAPPALGHIAAYGEGFVRMAAEGWVEDIGQDLPEAETLLLAAIQPPLSTGSFGDKVTRAAWENRPSWYVVSTEDRALSVDLQRDLARTIKAHTVELAASHMSLLSKPREVAEVILEAAAAT